MFLPLLLATTAVLQPPETSPPASPTTEEPAAPGPVAQGGDILVTARRRAETVQSVPIAIGVTTGAELERTGTNNVLRLTQLQPSLQLYSTNPRNTAANIRGLGSPFGLTNDGIEQGVGVYVDQVYNARIAATTFDFNDVERVEVLRGPQGTLYGKNTTAGAINVTTRAPSFDWEGRGEATYGNYDLVQGKGSISGPIVADKLAFRLGGTFTHRRGTIYNVATDEHVNEQQNIGIRGALLFKATDTLSFNLIGDFNRQNPDCCAQIYVRTGSTQRPLNRQYAALAAAFGYAVPSTDPFDRVTDVDSRLKAKQQIGGVSLRADWDVGPGTLTSVTAWRFWHWVPGSDRDYTGLPITTVSANRSQQDQYSQELRYAASGDRIDYTVGLFGFHQEIRVEGLQVQGAAASRFLLAPCTAANPNCNANNPAVLNGLTSANAIDFRNDSAAAFGQLTWKVTDRLRIQPGVRVNYDRKKGDYVSTVTNGAGVAIVCNPAPPAGALRDQCATLAPQSYQPKFDDWNLSGDLTLSYDIARDVHGYATYARSFKSGGINLSGLPLDANNQPILASATVKPEKVNHYEVGLKTQFDDRRVTLNLSAFWTEISDYQATVTNGQLGVLRGYLANADKVRVRGLEAEFAYRPTQNLNLYANASYTDAKYRKFVDAPCPPELSGGTAVTAATTVSAPGTPGGISPLNCDISGQRLPGVSRYAVSYGAEYRLPVQAFGREGEVYLGYDGSYRSRFSSNPSPSAYTYIGSYEVSNFRLGYRTPGQWNVFGWVRNAFDTKYFEVLALQSGNTGLVVGQPADPRTYGLTVARQF